MSLFKETKKEVPQISTASLPDIVFILLFFFMVVTKMRETSPKVKVKLPNATELTKMENKQLNCMLFIGKPTDRYAEKYGSAPRLQLNDQIGTTDDIPKFLYDFKEPILESNKNKVVASLRVDGEDVKMGIVEDVKVTLRKNDQRKVNYSARPGGPKPGQ